MARRVVKIAAAALLTTLSVAAVQASQWSPFWDALAGRPDATVTDGVNHKGEQTRSIELSSRVVFSLTRHGDRITSFQTDISGHGAVLCAWEIYVTVRAHIEACSPGEDPNFEANLDYAIDQINGFVAENSLVPITKPQLMDAIEQRKLQAKRAMFGHSHEGQRKRCEADGISSIAKPLKLAPQDAWVSGLTKLLSVKRPPVMNPCL
jgi:hypothetical protein